MTLSDRIRWTVDGLAIQALVWSVLRWRAVRRRGNCLIAIWWWWCDGGALIIQRSESNPLAFHVAVAKSLHPDQLIRHVQPVSRVFGPLALLYMFLHETEVVEETVARRDARIEIERRSQ